MTEQTLAGGTVLWRTRSSGEARTRERPVPAEPASLATTGSGVEVVLVHRPKYDDWTLPKGKTEHGESMPAAAVRETREETGVDARLGPWLRDVRYVGPGSQGPKLVRYWSAQACAFTAFVPNDEVDELRWMPPDDAQGLLSYGHDVDVVQRFVELGPPTSVLLLVRHAKAGSRQKWDGDDALRTLSRAGRRQAQDIAGLLALFGPDRVTAAPLVRCRDTVEPLAQALGLAVTDEPLLSETGYGDDPEAALARLHQLAGEPGATVVGSQGGVIPDAVAALARHAALPVAVDLDHQVSSKKGSVWVLGMRDGRLVSADYVEQPGG